MKQEGEQKIKHGFYFQKQDSGAVKISNLNLPNISIKKTKQQDSIYFGLIHSH